MNPRASDVATVVRRLQHTNWTDIETRLAAAMVTDAQNRARSRATHDGWPAGGGYEVVGASSGMVIDDETVQVTSVERAVFARLSESDRFHEHVVKAWAALDRMDEERITLLAELLKLSAEPDEEVNEGESPRKCWSCAQAGIDTDPDHYGNVSGNLDVKRDLCSAHYWFVKRYGCEATRAETLYHHKWGKWRKVAS